MKRILPATILGAILAMGSFGAIAAYAATPATTGAPIAAETGSGTEAVEAPGDTGPDLQSGLQSTSDTNGDFNGEQ
ncbi:MAG TPA: hypothetical protein VGT60_12095 [Candidatus Limnocylindria bacterium]|nr:hypothetical protein [Candidatus Limnocylindria bacterium]